MKKDYCVIGLGRFGQAVVDRLIDEGLSVMALDKDRKLINEIASKVSFSTSLDSTSIKSLKDVGIESFSHVFVTIGEDVEASIMTCAALIELGVKNITARAKNSGHEMVLRKMGIIDVVKPEEITGSNVAIRISTQAKSDVVSIASGLSIIKVKLENNKYSGSPINEIKSLNQDGVNVAAISRKNKTIWPNNDSVIELGDILHIVTENKLIKDIESAIRTK